MIVRCSHRFKGEAENNELYIYMLKKKKTTHLALCLQPPVTNKFSTTGGGTVMDW